MTFILVNLGTSTKYNRPPELPARGCTLVQFYNATEGVEVIPPGISLDAHFAGIKPDAVPPGVPITPTFPYVTPITTMPGETFDPSIKIVDGSIRKAIIDGPDGAPGTHKEIICANSLMLTLAQIAKAEKNIIFYAHSRGCIVNSVVTCRIQNIIDIIQDADNKDKTPDEIYTLIATVSPDDDLTIKAVKELISAEPNKAQLIALIPELKTEIQREVPKLSKFDIDPVPGGFNGTMGWFTRDHYHVDQAQWLEKRESYIQKHEESYAFSAAISHPTEKGTTELIPGHHGTAQGTLGQQNMDKGFVVPGISSEQLSKFTPLVQEVMLMKCLAFAQRRIPGVTFDPVRVSNTLPAPETRWALAIAERTLRQIVVEFNQFKITGVFKDDLYTAKLLEKYNELQSVSKFFDDLGYYTYGGLGTLAHFPIAFYFFVKNLVSSDQTQLITRGDRLCILAASDTGGYRYGALLQTLVAPCFHVNQEHLRLATADLDRTLQQGEDPFELRTTFVTREEECLYLANKIMKILSIKPIDDTHKASLKISLEIHTSQIITLLLLKSLTQNCKEQVTGILMQALEFKNHGFKEILQINISFYFEAQIDRLNQWSDVEVVGDDTSPSVPKSEAEILFEDFNSLANLTSDYNKLIAVAANLEKQVSIFRGQGLEFLSDDLYKSLQRRILFKKEGLVQSIAKKCSTLNLADTRIDTALKAQLILGVREARRKERAREQSLDVTGTGGSPTTDSPTASADSEADPKIAEEIETQLEIIRSTVTNIIQIGDLTPALRPTEFHRTTSPGKASAAAASAAASTEVITREYPEWYGRLAVAKLIRLEQELKKYQASTSKKDAEIDKLKETAQELKVSLASNGVTTRKQLREIAALKDEYSKKILELLAEKRAALASVHTELAKEKSSTQTRIQEIEAAAQEELINASEARATLAEAEALAANSRTQMAEETARLATTRTEELEASIAELTPRITTSGAEMRTEVTESHSGVSEEVPAVTLAETIPAVDALTQEQLLAAQTRIAELEKQNLEAAQQAQKLRDQAVLEAQNQQRIASTKSLLNKLHTDLFTNQRLDLFEDAGALEAYCDEITKQYQSSQTLTQIGVAGTITFGVLATLSVGGLAISLILIPGLNIFAIIGIGIAAGSAALAGINGVIATVGCVRKSNLTSGSNQIEIDGLPRPKPCR